eukprot:COSAG01_NODE_175_length_22996_cov_18.857892_2_plen_96_part_00
MAVFSRNVPNLAAAVCCCWILVLQIPEISPKMTVCKRFASPGASGLVGAAPPLWGRRLSCVAVPEAATARLPATGRALGLWLAQAGYTASSSVYL